VQVLTPALRACLDAADHQSMRFADVSEATLCAAVDASVESLKQQLIAAHRQVNIQKLASFLFAKWRLVQSMTFTRGYRTALVSLQNFSFLSLFTTSCQEDTATHLAAVAICVCFAVHDVLAQYMHDIVMHLKLWLVIQGCSI